MSSKETGGPAFPYSGLHKGEKETFIIDSHGMTLRDYFSAKVMQGTQSNPECNHWGTEQHVKYAYEAADAMLAARCQ